MERFAVSSSVFFGMTALTLWIVDVEVHAVLHFILWQMPANESQHEA